ncbi:cytochrome P450 [Microbacterium sp.]|uniref:cytochrome P450 n=1 Tax=Microbacterium sp. TaxID=51671 RepID=UPI0028117CAC|nr:cytochrome P450 [Microbacterium sp.]
MRDAGVMFDRFRDDSPLLLIRGYDFTSHIWSRVRDGARAAPLRLLGRDAVLVRGEQAVGLFYDERVIARHGAMPAFVQEVLFGHGSVHSLDGEEHHHRKATFVDVAYDDGRAALLHPELEREWSAELDAWVAGGRSSAYDAAVGAFGRAVMRWAGLPGTPAAKTRWSARLAQVVDGFGAPYFPAFLLALLNRAWSDRHAARLIRAVRDAKLDPAKGTALYEWAWHRDQRGTLLDERLAGIELQNVIRPMIAVARFVAFAAKELHDRPGWRERIAAETARRGELTGGGLATAFAQEVRRTAPFVPMLPGWALTDVDFGGQRVPTGGRVVIDIQGTDLDAGCWERPHEFRPERFVDNPDYEKLTAFIPHGGGDVASGHRCPGEKLAIAGLSAAVAALSDPRVTILDDGLDVNRRRLPTKPSSGANVRASRPARGCPVHDDTKGDAS